MSFHPCIRVTYNAIIPVVWRKKECRDQGVYPSNCTLARDIEVAIRLTKGLDASASKELHVCAMEDFFTIELEAGSMSDLNIAVAIALKHIRRSKDLRLFKENCLEGL